MISHTWISPDGLELPFNHPGDLFAATNGGIEGMGDPKTSDFVLDRAVLDGQGFMGFRATPRDCFWPVVLNPSKGDWEAAQSEFWTALPPGRYGKWRVTAPSGSVRELTCRYVPGDYAPAFDPSATKREILGINLIADDPWWHGPTVSKEFQTAETPLPFYATSGAVLNIMSSNTVDSATMTNPGDLPAWPLVQVNGPATSFEMSWYFPLNPGGAGYEISGTIDVASDQYLLIDTRPDQQTVRRYDSGGTFDNVFDQMTQVNWRPFPKGVDVPIYIELNGSGSLIVSFDPLYRRAV